MHKAHCLAAILVLAWVLAPTTLAETECIPATPGSCRIIIIIHLAFSYNDSEISQNQIDAWVGDIEDIWNGGDGQRLYGDCQCAVEFQVDAMQVTDPAQKNCNPGPPGYHCVMITDDAKNPPKNTNGTRTYRGYMYGVSNGSSVNGWWSDAMNAPAYAGGEPASDAAHEAGHMLGLPDDYDKGPPERYGNNIMGRTTGDYAYPTQDQINTVVENNCGEDACPDECCCGNGEVDKSEACDPMALPTGCGSGAYCCPYCCQCHYGGCVPGEGKYATDDDCKENCKDGDCMYNYETKCWDCVKKRPPAITPKTTPLPQFLSELIAGIISLVSPQVEPGTPGPVPGGVGEFILWIDKPAGEGNATQPGLWNATAPSAGNATVPARVCGDGACNGGETCSSCQQDCGVCPPMCGDLRCDAGEKCTCPDCACGTKQFCDPGSNNADGRGCADSRCGDRSCTSGETCNSCSRDCGDCPAVCGNRKCEHGESCSTCEMDCGHCAICGNGDCESGETCSSCQTDCGRCKYCGDGWCEGAENCGNCEADCLACPYCGDGWCNSGENCGNCPKDCPCVWGDGFCTSGETCECPDCKCPEGFHCVPGAQDKDAMGCSKECGDGTCAPGETEDSCPYDCLVTCVDNCGDGICAEVVCMAIGCPCAESHAGCPQDCP